MEQVIHDAAVKLCNRLKGGCKLDAQGKCDCGALEDVKLILAQMLEAISAQWDDDADDDNIVDPSDQFLQDIQSADMFYIKTEDDNGEDVYEVATQETVATMLAELADENQPIQCIHTCVEVNTGFAFVLPNMEIPGAVDMYAAKTYDEAERMRSNLRKREDAEFGEEKPFFPKERYLC